ncbi:MAG: ABC-type uncharacterized transport system involved in gliding motility auxiliary subunit [Myxococcota bacterium]|jgi:ABC-type uncharacterized transport system involved in gliding motility auxiliary subunit
MAETPRDPRESTTKLSPWSPVLAVIGGMLTLSFVAYAIAVGDAEALEAPWIAAGVTGVLLLGTWIYTEAANLRRVGSTKGAQYSATAGALVVVALGIAVALNVVASRYDERVDLTESRRFTLSEQSRDILAGLAEPVTVRAFFGAGSVEESEFRSLIEGYEQASDKLTVELIDPLRSPLLAEQYAITSQWGTVILASGEADQRLEGEFTEEEVTNALVRLTSGVEHVLCFSEGHEELDPEEDYDPAGLGAARARLDGLNYRVRKVSLYREGGVPAECAVLVVADPQHDWLPAEHELLAAHIASGGHALVMLEPSHAPGLAADLGRYGVAVGDDLILESGPNAQLFGGDLSYIILDPDSFDFHPITEKLQSYTLHRLARTVGQGSPVEGIDVQELARTTASSWAKTDLETLTDVTPTPTDRMGPLPMMVSAEVTDPAAVTINPFPAPILPGEDAPRPPITLDVERAAGGRLVVIGDVDFATNALLAQGNNLDLFMNTLAWMVGEEDQLTIRPNEAAEGIITMNLVQGLLVWLICLMIAPGMAMLGAISTWRTRRQR